MIAVYIIIYIIFRMAVIPLHSSLSSILFYLSIFSFPKSISKRKKTLKRLRESAQPASVDENQHFVREYAGGIFKFSSIYTYCHYAYIRKRKNNWLSTKFLHLFGFFNETLGFDNFCRCFCAFITVCKNR